LSSDRFVYWKEETPSREQIQLVLEDYVRDLAESVKWEQDRFFVKLPGMCSNPAARVTDNDTLRRVAEEDRKNERWIEVWMDKKCLDVITRRGDWITNSIADTFAKICAQFWNGRLEME
jgi:hypothetical protein